MHSRLTSLGSSDMKSLWNCGLICSMRCFSCEESHLEKENKDEDHEGAQ